MRKEVSNWWEQAEKDLEVAWKNFKFDEYYAATFFCQQAVEKALKSFYIYKLAKSPGQTHSLIYLAKETRSPKKFYPLLQELTPEFVTTRYPDVINEVPYKLYNKTKTNEYLTKSEELLKWIKNQIGKQ